MITGTWSLVAFLASATPAADRDVAVVIPLCDDAPGLSQLAAELGVQLSGRGWRLGSPAASPQRSCEEQSRARAADLLAEGRRLFEESLRYDAARLKLEEGAQLFSTAGAWLRAPDVYAQIHFYLGWIALQLEQRDLATTHFSQALLAQSGWRPNKQDFPPVAIKAYREAVHALARAPEGRVSIQTAPAGAAVVVDGAQRCTAPCELRVAAALEHFVEARLAGYRVASTTLRVAGGATVAKELTLVADAREALAAEITGNLREGDVAFNATPPAAVAVVLQAGGASGAVAHVLRDDTELIVHTPVSLDAKGAAELVASIGSPALPPPVDLPPVERGAFTGLTGRWWFWGAIGVGALAAGALVLRATASDELLVTVRP